MDEGEMVIMEVQEVHGNNYSSLQIDTNSFDKIRMTATNGDLEIYFEFTERWKIQALLNILIKARDEIWNDVGKPHYLKDKPKIGDGHNG